MTQVIRGCSVEQNCRVTVSWRPGDGRHVQIPRCGQEGQRQPGVLPPHRCLLCLALLIVATTAAVPAVPAPCVPRMRTSRSSTSDYAIAARRGPAAEAARAAAAGQWRDQLAILCWLQCGCILARVLSEAPVVSPTIALQAPAFTIATSEPSPVC